MDDDRWKDDLATARGLVRGAIYGSAIWFFMWLIYILVN